MGRARVAVRVEPSVWLFLQLQTGSVFGLRIALSNGTDYIQRERQHAKNRPAGPRK